MIKDSITTETVPSHEAIFLILPCSWEKIGFLQYLVLCWYHSFLICIIKKRYSKKPDVYKSLLASMKPQDDTHQKLPSPNELFKLSSDPNSD